MEVGCQCVGKFITVSLHSESGSVFQGNISWRHFPRPEKCRLPWEDKAGASLGRDFCKLGRVIHCNAAVGIVWEDFSLCFSSHGQGQGEQRVLAFMGMPKLKASLPPTT